MQDEINDLEELAFVDGAGMTSSDTDGDQEMERSDENDDGKEFDDPETQDVEE